MTKPLYILAVALFACGSHPIGAGSGPSGGEGDSGSAGGVGQSGTSSDRVQVTQGPLRGVIDGETFSFRGIPYAAPPVGPRRWRPPGDPPAWTEERSAQEFGQPCPQVDAERKTVTGSEDCLTLNVWTPKVRPGPLPVLVFVHGGDNYWGSATGRTSDGLYDGARIAERGPAVVVTLDYRLAALGFLAHRAFAAENTEHTTGNWALLDQIRALRWVNENVAAFGGDPTRVLLFGQSAGSYDTCALVTSPLTHGLFQRALMESGPCWIPPQADIDLATSAVLSATGCANATDVAACLRAVPMETLASLPVSSSDDAGMHKYFYPSVDGYVLAEAPMAALLAGRHQHMPLVFGTNAEEMTTLLATVQLGAPLTASDYHTAVVATVGSDHALDVETTYAGDALLSFNRAYLNITGDLFFHCRMRRTARAAHRGQSEPVWRYLYAHSLANGSVGGAPASVFGAGHGLELLVLFDDHHDQTQSIWWQPTATERGLTSWMEATWTALAASGSVGQQPNAIAWEHYDPTRDNHMVLDDALSTADGLRTGPCDFWDTIDSP
jgi:para-nitrobenzyl esterase